MLHVFDQCDALAGQHQTLLIRLPAEIGLGDTDGKDDPRRRALGIHGMRFIDRGLDARLLFTPPVEAVAGLDPQVRLRVPVEAEEAR